MLKSAGIGVWGLGRYRLVVAAAIDPEFADLFAPPSTSQPSRAPSALATTSHRHTAREETGGGTAATPHSSRAATAVIYRRCYSLYSCTSILMLSASPRRATSAPSLTIFAGCFSCLHSLASRSSSFSFSTIPPAFQIHFYFIFFFSPLGFCSLFFFSFSFTGLFFYCTSPC